MAKKRRWWTRWLQEPEPKPHYRIAQCGMIGCRGPWIPKPNK